MKLSVLDQAPITSGNTAVGALEKAEELAIVADELGYTRMWMAEHHGMRVSVFGGAGGATARLAAKTNQIRIGTGGVMMMHYSPLKMAEVFKTLSAFSPGRIDFGVGRAPGGDPQSMYALAEGRQPRVDNMYEKFDHTLQLINDELTEDKLYAMIASPRGVTLPEAWMLGSSGNGQLSNEILNMYRENFIPSPFMEKPEINVAYLVTAAETKEEAEYEAKPQDIARLWLMQGKMGQLLTPEDAKDYPLSEMDLMKIEESRKLHIVGSAKEVAEKLQVEQEQYGFDEAMICSIQHSQEKRLQVYRLLAKELF